MPCLTQFHSLFYVNKIKIVPQNIYELLTPVALAHLIMGDGAVIRHGLIICTNSYSIQDIIRLINVLIIRYRLECGLHLKRQNQKIEYMIYIRQASMPLLRTIVAPYFHPSMYYKIKFTPSTAPGTRSYSTTSYADAESSFILKVRKDSKYKTGYNIQPVFVLCVHKKDLNLLKRIAAFFGVGNITKSGEDSIMYRVSSLKDINQVIIPHFENNPLISQKRADYELFKQAVELMNSKAHLTLAGLQKILNLKASMNKGLPNILIASFPNTVPVPRPLVTDQQIKDPH